MNVFVKKAKIPVVLLICFTLSCLNSCKKDSDDSDVSNSIYRKEMRNFVIGISQNAKAAHPGFLIIPQNGIELITENGEADGTTSIDYLAAIDANGQEDLFYGYANDDVPTLPNERDYLIDFLTLSKNNGNIILVTDYCSTLNKMDHSYAQNQSRGFVSFAADHRELDHIPTYPDPIFAENSENIESINQVKNFLYLINPAGFNSKQAFIDSVADTNYDLIIMDLFSSDNVEFTSDEIAQLKTKANGGSRLVVCYMSIGEAEDYRYYWNPEWNTTKPGWLQSENPDWPGNYKVKYWDPDWQTIIYGNSDSYLSKILAADFDGVYLDIIDGFEYFE